MVHPGTYGCTPKSCIPASGCGPRTIPDLCDHPISRTPALRSYDRRSLAPGRKGAGKPPLVYMDKHSSAIGALTVAETTAETGDQGIHQTTHLHYNTWHNTDATHSIDRPPTPVPPANHIIRHGTEGNRLGEPIEKSRTRRRQQRSRWRTEAPPLRAAGRQQQPTGRGTHSRKRPGHSRDDIRTHPGDATCRTDRAERRRRHAS